MKMPTAIALVLTALAVVAMSGCMDSGSKTLVAHHDDGFHIIMTPPEGMSAEQFADAIHGGDYSSVGGWDCAEKSFEVSSYTVYEDYRDYYDGIKNVVAQGGKAKISYEWGYSPLNYEDGTVQVTVMENITIERI